MPDIDSLPDSAVARQRAVGVLRWPEHRWQPPRWPELGFAFPDTSQVRAWSDRIGPAWVDLACVVLWLLGLAGILIVSRWQVMLTVAPLTASMFLLVVWQGRRRQAATAESVRVSAANERLLALQNRFLQEASHSLKTPITIALGHSELLAQQLVDQQAKRDIAVVVGELNRLRQLSERLLLIAASADPDFLRPEVVELAEFVGDVMWRWRPTAERRWQLGRLDEVTVLADRERLGLAVDALLENAVQHTRAGDTITLSVIDDESGRAKVVVEDSGAGIAPAELANIFERFATGSQSGRRGTGLGLALVRAVAYGHGGEVTASSTVGRGSRFELGLPLRPATMAIETSTIESCRSS